MEICCIEIFKASAIFWRINSAYGAILGLSITTVASMFTTSNRCWTSKSATCFNRMRLEMPL